jgi:hypothetical protein
MRKVLVAKFDSAEAFSTALSGDATSAAAYTTAGAVSSASSFLTGVTTTTAATASDVADAVEAMVDVGNVGSTFTLTSAVDLLTGTTKNDTFSGTQATASAADTIDGGAGKDTFAINHSGGAEFTNVGKFSNVEIVDVTNQSGSSASSGTTESSNITFQDLAVGQTVILAGITFTAGSSGATAAQVAAAFIDPVGAEAESGDDIATANTYVVNGGTLTGFTAATSKTLAEADVIVTAVMTAAGYTITAGGSVVEAVATSTSASTDVSDLQITGTAVTGKNQVTTLTVTTDTDGAASIIVDGQTVTYTGGADAAGEATVLAATLNGFYGDTFATASAAVVTVSTPFVTNISRPTGTNSDTAVTLASGGNFAAAAAPTVVTTDGVASVSAKSYTTTVKASDIGGSTEMAAVNSTGNVDFTDMVSQKAVVEGNGSLTNGNTSFSYKDTATSTDVEVQNGVTSGDITINAAKAVSSTLTSKGATNVVGTVDFDYATAVTIDAKTKLTGTAFDVLATSGATLTINGGGAVSLGTLNAGFDTVNASGNSGGITAAIGTDIVDTVFTGSSANDKITASTKDSIGSSDKLAVDAGGGTADKLIVGDGNDVNTAADGARYTNFEVLDISDDQDVSLVSGITSVVAGAMTSKTISGLSASNSDSITLTGDQGTAFTVVLTDASGSSDSVTLNASSATSTTNVDVAGLTVANVETLNFNATTGVSGTDSDLAFASSGANKLTALNLTGSADIKVTTGGNLDKAVTIDGQAMTGAFDLTGALTAGSVVKATAKADTIALGAAGSSYQLGAGKDAINDVAVAELFDGSSYATIDGGDGTDTITLAVAATTLNDSHFTKLSNVEKLVADIDGGANAFSLTGGSEFSEAFASGFTADIEVGDAATTLAAGSATTNIKFDLDSEVVDEDITITTGTGADEIIVTTSAATAMQLTVNTGVGDDSVSYTHSTSTLTLGGTSDPMSFDLGTGADSLTMSGITAAEADHVSIVIEAGDSLVGSFDTITGYLDGVTGAEFGMKLDFDGTAAIASAVTSVDVTGFTRDQATMSSNAIGLVTFAGTSTLTLQNKIDAVQAQFVAANDTVVFEHVADSYVFHNDSDGDSLVKLVGQAAAGIGLDTSTTATTGEIIIG